MRPGKALVDLVAEDRGGRARLLQPFRRDFAMEARGQQPSVLLSSSRSSTCRMMRKLEGTRPEASPECTPSVRISTFSVPPASAAQRRGEPQLS
jgi:hypothetical protein